MKTFLPTDARFVDQPICGYEAVEKQDFITLLSAHTS